MSNTKLTKAILQTMSISSLLDVPLDQIEEAASYVVPPVGAYILNVKALSIQLVGKADNAKEAITFDFTVESTMGLEAETDTPVEDGSEFNISYMAGTGIQYFKRDFAAVNAAVGAANLAQAIEKLPGVKISCLITHRLDSKDPSKKYPQLSEIQVV